MLHKPSLSAFEAPADPRIYAVPENNKHRECSAKLAGAGENHLRGREPWGMEENGASEYVSSAKPISKWLPAPWS